MKISHESPLDLLEMSKLYNDYEYSLLHLMDIPEYKEFYKNTNRYHILDNSAFEFQFIEGGFDLDYFIDIINEVKPSTIIIPDIIADKDKTIEAFENFPFERLDYKPLTIGVVQGKTFKELEECFDFMNKNADIVALVFHSPAYQDLGYETKESNNANGRISLYESIKDRLKKPLHLLGCSTPKEFTHYENDVMTIDTANPIQWGILEKSINLDEKPNCILDKEKITSPTKNKALILENIKEFRKLCE